MQIAQKQQTDHQTMIDNLQQQIDFLTNKFTNAAALRLDGWEAVRRLFPELPLAYAMAKRAERNYRYELALPSASSSSSAIGTACTGPLAGESLMTDLHRMHASYLDLNVRRYEISRIVSLA